MSLSVQERLFDVRDLRVVVTGAASGLGLAMAEVLAECGARVTLADVDAGRLDEVTADLVADGGSARAVVADVSDESSVQALIDDVVAVEAGWTSSSRTRVSPPSRAQGWKEVSGSTRWSAPTGTRCWAST